MWVIRLLNAQGTPLCAEQARRAIWTTRRMLEKINDRWQFTALVGSHGAVLKLGEK
jgi:hypothetical protein